MKKQACIFVRVSTDKQNYERQITDLKAFAEYRGIEVVDIIGEQISGAVDNDSREGLQQLIEKAKQGCFEKVLVTEISRLGRNAFQVQTLLHEMSKLGVSVVIQTLGIETLDDKGKESPLGSLMVAIMAQLSQMERQNLIERINSGIARAKANGKVLGRKTGFRLSDSFINKKYGAVLKDIKNGLSVRKVAKLHGVSTGTVQKLKGVSECKT